LIRRGGIFQYTRDIHEAAEGRWPASPDHSQARRAYQPKSIRVFDNEVLELFSKSHWVTPGIWFGPFIVYALGWPGSSGIERLCRYILRGPLAVGRLTKGRRGNLVYQLKKPRPDGTTHIVLSPLALLQRLSWLCVLPRAHTPHYHGVLAPAHPWRALIVT
jgi:hypothetical protein